MRPQENQAQDPGAASNTPVEIRKIEIREWWLWSFAVTVTLALTFALVSFTLPWFHLQRDSSYWLDLREWVRGLAALVLLFDVYTMYQQLQLHRVRRQLAERDQLFELISENAADMIALVDENGRRLYNSPAYQKVLGYSSAELRATPSIEQVHPEDQQKVLQAAEKTRRTGQGQRLEYRIRHKDGSWRILESTASAIRDGSGRADKLVIVNRDITERRRAEDLLTHHTFHDALTDLPNRALFLDRLQHALTRSKRRANYKFAILLIDVDDFKIFNDSLGHSSGDELLIKIGERLITSLRDVDTISRTSGTSESPLPPSNDSLARLGGDEFTVLLDDIQNPSDAIRVAERTQKRLAAPFTINGQDIVVSVSIGIAFSSTSCARAEDLLRDADIAMYRAKRKGKSSCEVFDTAMHATAVRRLALETDLRRALEDGEFKVYYQPIVSLQTGKITGFEALTRWQRPDCLVPPAEFIPVAEESGLILAMNRQLMFEACRQLRVWQSLSSTNETLTMSVNVTPKQFAHPDLVSQIGMIIEQTRLDPSRLQLEIMETIAMREAESAGQRLFELKALGVGLSIDDFGTGYSSLNRLQKIPVDSLKIDRSFISNMSTDKQSGEIVRIIVMLAHNLGLKVVAEGVETREQMSGLKLLNCELAQGYFFSRPADQHAMSKLLIQDLQYDATVISN